MVVNKTKEVGEITLNSASSMGSMNYSIPFEMPEGRNGLAPSMNITYSSGAGNSVLGYGWGIGGLSSIISSNFSDYYDGFTNSASLNQLHPFTLDGMRLIEVSNSGGVITYEPEQGNLRVKGYLTGSIVKYFTVEYPNGSKANYGFVTNTTGQIFYPLTQLKDVFDNLIDYSYSLLNNQYY